MKCPRCGAKLLKPKPDDDKIIVKGIMTKTRVKPELATVMVVSEWEWKVGEKEPKLKAKKAYCAFCGAELGRREFS